MKNFFAFCLVFTCIFLPCAYCCAAPAFFQAAEYTSFVSKDWEQSYAAAARITIEKGVMSVMNGIYSAEQLCESVDYFCRTWESWEHSPLFILRDDRDIDVYGNLYSLQVMCRTLFLAARDWHERENSNISAAVLEKALDLEHKSRLLAAPVAEIIIRQSYSAYLPRRVEIMKQQFPYVDEYYACHSFHERMESSKP